MISRAAGSPIRAEGRPPCRASNPRIGVPVPLAIGRSWNFHGPLGVYSFRTELNSTCNYPETGVRENG